MPDRRNGGRPRSSDERAARDLISSVAVTVGASTSETDALQRALDAVCTHTGWPAGHAFVLAPEGADLVSAGLWHLSDPERFEEFRAVTSVRRFAVGEGLPGRVLASGRAVWITDVASDPDFPRARALSTSAIGAAFAFPVRAVEGVVAVLEFFSGSTAPPDAALVEVMDTIGVLVGQALDRFRADARLRDAEGRFRSVAEAALDAIVAADGDGNVTFWNAGAQRMFGWAASEVLGRPLDFIIPPAHREHHRTGMHRLRHSGRPRVVGGPAVELSALRRDGTEFPVELSLGSWGTGLDVSFSAVIRDVTERQAAQARLREIATELARKNEALERSHAELLQSYRQAERIFAAYAEILPGTELDGRYRLEERIGSGGYGVVYRATQIQLDRAVAVKLFRPASGRITPDHLRRFRLEGISTCRVVHPNAVTVLDTGMSSDGLPFIVMELLEGRTLGEALQADGPLTLRRAAEVGADVAAALATAHASGIVHRDVKPENVYLHRTREEEVVKILDFGIAKLVGDTIEHTVGLTGTGHMIGTPAYMAPERLGGGEVDGRTDVYSVGVMLYELIAGHVPFPASGGGWDAARHHLLREPLPLRSLDASVPEALDRLILRALAKDPATRPEAAAFAEDLARLAPTLPEIHLATSGTATPEAPTMELDGATGPDGR